MENCKPVDVPLMTGTKLSKELCPNTTEEKQRMKSIPYSSALDCFMYAMLFTRPDLIHAIGILSRYQKNPREEQWKQIKNVLRYVKEHWIIHCVLTVIIFSCRVILMLIDKGIWMTGNLRLVTYLLWQECSRKQSSVAFSSMEAEYIAASEAAKEGVWLSKFLASLKVVESASLPVTIFCYNMAAIKVSKNPKFYSKSKHIEGMYHYIRDVINRLKAIRLIYLPIADMVMDPLTKPIGQESFSKHMECLKDVGVNVERSSFGRRHAAGAAAPAGAQGDGAAAACSRALRERQGMPAAAARPWEGGRRDRRER
ncbi:hypothetical protein U9M48_011904 [Paspalum notatum var. saurae]|uniref:Retrovirus-related Pol polyprotein from transposon TNT 1-94 n=1 Tax=Paspalum notatum var. saurae TaxID=547442 RepID=A0AAQ3SWU4_PASNO